MRNARMSNMPNVRNAKYVKGQSKILGLGFVLGLTGTGVI